jgi:hypothetical protein
VGWRERDWAKFTDEEWRAVYGFDPARGPSYVPPSSAGNVTRRTPEYLRILVWSAVTALALGTAGLVYQHSAKMHLNSAAAVAPAVIYGIPGSANAGDGVFGPGGAGTACTEEDVDPTLGGWRCLSWQINQSNAPVIVPHAYDGQCSHLVADQSRGAWLCLSAALPTRPAVVPPGSA